MFQTRSWPSAILHLDADAFFASVMQVVYPRLKGKPVVVGKERGIATACSYEAKKLGVKRGLRITEIKKNFPQIVIVDSDYEIYALFSQKIFSILRRFTPLVEEYSVDEGFADIKGLRRPLNMGYEEIGAAIKNEIETSLGLTVSVGISLTKSLAKLASSYKKPSGLMVVDGLMIGEFLVKIPVEEIWGVGENTASYLQKLGIKTALDFASQNEEFIKKHLTKPFFEIWQELHGEKIYEINPYQKNNFRSITRSATFYPPTNNFNILFSRVLSHLEEAFFAARRADYLVGEIEIFLKTQDFRYRSKKIKLRPKIFYPFSIHQMIKQELRSIVNQREIYRATGCCLFDFEENHNEQISLFSDQKLETKVKKIYPFYEEKKIDFGTALYDKNNRFDNKKIKKLAIPLINL
jgi:DNA polymerase-4/DNA polymerase V